MSSIRIRARERCGWAVRRGCDRMRYNAPEGAALAGSSGACFLGRKQSPAVLCAGVVLGLTLRAAAIDTVGAFLDPLHSQGQNLTSAAWTARIDQYDGPPLQGFELRIDFISLHFTGSSNNCV